MPPVAVSPHVLCQCAVIVVVPGSELAHVEYRRLSSLLSLSVGTFCIGVWCAPAFTCPHRLLLGRNQLTGTVPPTLAPLFPPSSSSFAVTCVTGAAGQYDGCSLPDRSALVDLYAATGGPGWLVSANWLSASHPCTWSGVSCGGPAGPVIGLLLTSNGLTGTLPDSLSLLTAVTSIDMSVNGLTGQLPSTLGALTAMQFLSLAGNSLSGTVPSEIRCVLGASLCLMSWLGGCCGVHRRTRPECLV